MSEAVNQTVSLADQIVQHKQALQDATVAITSNHHETPGWWSTGNAMTMSASVLLFGVVILLAMTYHIKKYNITEVETRLFIIVLVVFASLFLVVSGYSDSQIAPVMGLLGTIVGYILRGSSQDSTSKNLQDSEGPQGIQGSK